MTYERDYYTVACLVCNVMLTSSHHITNRTRENGGKFFTSILYNKNKMSYFKHIVNLERIKGYNGVNLKMGYSTIEIRNPKDLVYYGEKI